MKIRDARSLPSVAQEDLRSKVFGPLERETPSWVSAALASSSDCKGRDKLLSRAVKASVSTMDATCGGGVYQEAP